MIRSLMTFGLAGFLATSSAHASVSFQWALIGNPGNANDPTENPSRGAVAYEYAIAKTEVTNADYVEFLNAVAASDPNGLYNKKYMGDNVSGGIVRTGESGSYAYSVKSPWVGVVNGDDYSYANKPVNFVSYFDALRFANWMHNGQGNGSTETGAYDMSRPLPGLAERSPDAKFWIPTRDEWYKAAYHDAEQGAAGIYFDFATGSNEKPDNNLPSGDTGNSVNYNDGSGRTMPWSSPGLTDVGAYQSSLSPYGTWDQDGNVAEISSTPLNEGTTYYSLMGGSFVSVQIGADLNMMNWFELGTPGVVESQIESGHVGFRIAGTPLSAEGNQIVPEPSMLGVFGLLGSLAVGCARRFRPDAVAG